MKNHSQLFYFLYDFLWFNIQNLNRIWAAIPKQKNSDDINTIAAVEETVAVDQVDKSAAQATFEDVKSEVCLNEIYLKERRIWSTGVNILRKAGTKCRLSFAHVGKFGRVSHIQEIRFREKDVLCLFIIILMILLCWPKQYSSKKKLNTFDVSD